MALYWRSGAGRTVIDNTARWVLANAALRGLTVWQSPGPRSSPRWTPRQARNRRWRAQAPASGPGKLPPRSEPPEMRADLASASLPRQGIGTVSTAALPFGRADVLSQMI